MRGFEIERTLDEDTCSMETLPEKILKVPGIALVAAGTPACLIGLYDSCELPVIFPPKEKRTK